LQLAAAIGKMHFLTIYVLLLLLVPFILRAQSPSESIQNPLASNYRLYTKQTGGSLLIYNGVEYTATYPDVQGSSYFNNTTLQPGLICFNHIVYYDVPLAYNMVTNQLITKSYNGFNIVLSPDMVDSFVLSGHTFIYLGADSSNQYHLQEGYYDRIYSGKTQALIKRRKQVERGSRTEDPFKFHEYDDYLIYKNRQYYKVETKKDVNRIVKDHSKEVNAYLRSKKIKFKKHKEKYIAESLSYYDQLTR
jgi:hypothetical protein